MRSLPEAAVAYRRTAEFTETTIPAGLRSAHSTKAGVWGRIVVVAGRLRYRILEPALEEHELAPDVPGIVEPEARHEVEPLGTVRFYVEFLREEAPDGDSPRQIAIRFNDAINARQIDAIDALISDDHRFVDAAGGRVEGRAAVLEAWRGFFAAFPDYRNDFDAVEAKGAVVTIAGRSTCADERLEGAALWTARIEAGRVAQWRVYEDTPEERARLGIESAAVRP